MRTMIVVAMIMVVLEPQCLVGVPGKERLVSKILGSWGFFFNWEKKKKKKKKPKSLATKSLFV